VGGPVLLDADALRPYIGSVIFEVFDHDLSVFQKGLTDTDPFRLPSGYKTDVYTFRVAGTAIVTSISVAETGKQLATV
jgi:hypothetical protein